MDKKQILKYILAGFIGFCTIWLIMAFVLNFYGWLVGGYDPENHDNVNLPPPPIPTANYAVPLSWKAHALSGEEFVISEKFPNKVLFLNLWATWCGPCIKEMPSIQKLHDRFKDKVAFLCLSDEESGEIQKFVEKEKYTLPFYYYPKGSLPSALQTRGIPATFIISKEGTVAFAHVGAVNWNHENVATFLEDLLAQ